MPSYRCLTVPVAELERTCVKSMCSLYLQHYEGCTVELFERDLNNKDEVLLLFSEKELVGFTALKVLFIDSLGIRVIYSGDTVVARAHWGQQNLAMQWIARAGQIHRQQPDTPLYWLLLVKGHRTYRYLPAFTKRWHPHWKRQETELHDLADVLGSRLFGANYYADTGLVRFSETHGHLKAALADPSPREINLDAVRFFLQRNSQYKTGDELVCITQLATHNLRPLAARLFSPRVADSDHHDEHTAC